MFEIMFNVCVTVTVNRFHHGHKIVIFFLRYVMGGGDYENFVKLSILERFFCLWGKYLNWKNYLRSIISIISVKNQSD